MLKQNIYDAIIVGAGPAGLSCASSIKGEVLLIEKKKEPYKRIACAEWVPPFFGAKEVIQETTGMITLYPGGVKHNRWKGKVIDRNLWQRNQVESLTCEVHLGEKVNRIEGKEVITDKGRYSGEWVIGADGPVSIVRKSMGIPEPPVLPAVNVKLPLKLPLYKTITAFFSEIKNGYAWCFPRGERANVGVGMIGKIKDGLMFWVEKLVKMGVVKREFIEWTAGLIPLGGLLPLVKDRLILTGDAGGFIDPLTGAGIFYAYESGKEAARIIKGEISAEDYENRMKASYESFFERRKQKRKIMEDKWENLKEAVESGWISFSRG